MMESLKKEYTDISSIFDALIIQLETMHKTVNADFDKEREAMMKSLTVPVSDNAQESWDGEKREQEREAQKQREKQIDSKIEVRRRKELLKITQAITLVWVVYMRVTRRCQNIKLARVVFSRARKSSLCTYHIFIASGIFITLIFFSVYGILLQQGCRCCFKSV
jgi:cleavage stimulation factor subunit 3